MTYFVLPYLNNIIDPINIKLKFSDKSEKIKNINPSLKNYLNYIKNLISNYLYDWDNIKRYTNVHEFIHTSVPKYNISISKIKPISRAFFKLIEIYITFNIFENMPDNINTFHLAEGPGGFIEATTYMRKSNMKDKYYGITLLNNDKQVPNWRKMDILLKKFPNINIIYGEDGTGNLYHHINLNHCHKKYKNSMDIITADGGFDFSSNFDDQENNVFRLLLTQVFYALSLQKKNGHFILKMFDIFNINSLQILYLLSCFYKKVIITKPNTSRQANSEKYIVCKNFKITDTTQITNKLINVLKILENIDFTQYNITEIIDLPMQKIYADTVIEANSILGNKQIENINATIKLINNKDKSDKLYNLKNNNISKCIKWCVKNSIPYNKIDNNKNIFLSN
jgi:23S rRNA U2552 (ribose-2'-O)-methylase RlmE/FtsJ